MFDIKTSILDFMQRMANYHTMLKKHFRGYPEIIGYSNQTFYQNQLQIMKIRTGPIEEVLQFHSIESSPQDDATHRNINMDECDYILKQIEALKKDGVAMNVGILTPFRNQQAYIYSRALEHPDSNYFFNTLKLKVMTSCLEIHQ